MDNNGGFIYVWAWMGFVKSQVIQYHVESYEW